jgi:hypothetical protein
LLPADSVILDHSVGMYVPIKYYVYEEWLILITFKEYQETNVQNVKQKNPQQDYYISINDILTKPTKKSSNDPVHIITRW